MHRDVLARHDRSAGLRFRLNASVSVSSGFGCHITSSSASAFFRVTLLPWNCGTAVGESCTPGSSSVLPALASRTSWGAPDDITLRVNAVFPFRPFGVLFVGTQQASLPTPFACPLLLEPIASVPTGMTSFEDWVISFPRPQGAYVLQMARWDTTLDSIAFTNGLVLDCD